MFSKKIIFALVATSLIFATSYFFLKQVCTFESTFNNFWNHVSSSCNLGPNFVGASGQKTSNYFETWITGGNLVNKNVPFWQLMASLCFNGSSCVQSADHRNIIRYQYFDDRIDPGIRIVISLSGPENQIPLTIKANILHTLNQDTP